jgi:hypothetical protein
VTHEFTPRDVAEARRLLDAGVAPSEILRRFAVAQPDASVADLAQLARSAWNLPFEATQCLGGWWHDGSGELSDAQIDAFLLRAIEQR